MNTYRTLILGGKISNVDSELLGARYKEISKELNKCFDRLASSFKIAAGELRSLQEIRIRIATPLIETRKPLSNREDGWYRQFANKKRYQR